MLSKDEIRTYSLSYLQPEIVSEEVTFVKETLMITTKLKAKVDVHKTEELIKKMFENEDFKSELNRQIQKIKNLEKEIRELQKAVRGSNELKEAGIIRKKRIRLITKHDDTIARLKVDGELLFQKARMNINEKETQKQSIKNIFEKYKPDSFFNIELLGHGQPMTNSDTPNFADITINLQITYRQKLFEDLITELRDEEAGKAKFEYYLDKYKRKQFVNLFQENKRWMDEKYGKIFHKLRSCRYIVLYANKRVIDYRKFKYGIDVYRYNGTPNLSAIEGYERSGYMHNTCHQPCSESCKKWGQCEYEIHFRNFPLTDLRELTNIELVECSEKIE